VMIFSLFFSFLLKTIKTKSGIRLNLFLHLADSNLHQPLRHYHILEQGRYKSIREIAEAIGKSRQWVYIYLEALASLEVVDLRGFIYVVISRQNVPKIGRKVQKGILGLLRSLNRIGGQRKIDAK
ncbi:MAG: hypothetical protein PHS04_13395, partial [Tissierellia bacterium]|nr:hypothetical protein [Tissierellia bacterium]